MPAEDAEIWMYLLLALAALGLHGLILWRDLRVEALQIELLLLQWELARMAPFFHLGDSEAMRRLGRLVSQARRHADNLIFLRLLLAWLFLRRSVLVKRLGTCRQLVDRQVSAEARDRTRDIYQRFEAAVANRIFWGSPVLWIIFLSRSIVQVIGLDRAGQGFGPAGRVPGVDLLEFTFPIDRD